MTLKILHIHLTVVKNDCQSMCQRTEKRFKWWKWNQLWTIKKRKEEIQSLIFEMLIVERVTIIENEYVIYLHIAINMLSSILLFAAFFIHSMGKICILYRKKMIFVHQPFMYVNVSNSFFILSIQRSRFIFDSHVLCNAIICLNYIFGAWLVMIQHFKIISQPY